MSAVKKTAKTTLYIFSFLVLLLIVGAGYLYVNMGSIAKQLTESIASQTLGVEVKVGKMNINLEKTQVTVQNLSIANPEGYKKEHAITVNTITVEGKSFTKELLTFSNIVVDGTEVNLEVADGRKSNIMDIKNNISSSDSSTRGREKQSEGAHSDAKAMKVIVEKFALTKARLNPTTTLVDADLGSVTVPDIHLQGIGQKQNGVLAQEAIAQIMDAVLVKMNKAASREGLLSAMSGSDFDSLKESFKKDTEGLKQGFKNLIGK